MGQDRCSPLASGGRLIALGERLELEAEFLERRFLDLAHARGADIENFADLIKVQLFDEIELQNHCFPFRKLRFEDTHLIDSAAEQPHLRSLPRIQR